VGVTKEINEKDVRGNTVEMKSKHTNVEMKRGYEVRRGEEGKKPDEREPR
jgi:hypothetical protein